MRSFRRFSVLLLGLAFFFLIEEQRILAVGGVNPNVILVFLLFLVFSGEPIVSTGPLILGFLGIVFLWTPFWLIPETITAGIAFSAAVFYRFLTGNRLLDFSIALVAATVLVYCVSIVPHFGLVRFFPLVFGVIYNVALGTVVWFLNSARRSIYR